MTFFSGFVGAPGAVRPNVRRSSGASVTEQNKGHRMLVVIAERFDGDVDRGSQGIKPEVGDGDVFVIADSLAEIRTDEYRGPCGQHLQQIVIEFFLGKVKVLAVVTKCFNYKTILIYEYTGQRVLFHYFI